MEEEIVCKRWKDLAAVMCPSLAVIKSQPSLDHHGSNLLFFIFRILDMILFSSQESYGHLYTKYVFFSSIKLEIIQNKDSETQESFIIIYLCSSKFDINYS